MPWYIMVMRLPDFVRMYLGDFVMTSEQAVRATVIVVFTALAMAGAGCSGNGATPSAPQQPPAPNGVQGPTRSAPTGGSIAWQAMAGGNRRDQALQALDFFPGTITIDVGDSVTWTVGGNAHTITFFGPLTSPLLPIEAPFGGSTYDGSTYTSSGFVASGQTYTLTFTKAGTYPFECLFHSPEMAGLIIVQPKGSPYPHPQGFYTGQGNAEMNSQLAAAQGSLSEFPYATDGLTIAAGISPGLGTAPPNNSTVLRYLDAPILGPRNGSTVVSISAGTTLTWTVQSSNEPHTITVPPAGQSPPPGLSPFAPPFGGTSYNGTALVHSGPLFPTQSFSLTFTSPGIFTVFCIFHDAFGMVETVIVH